MTRFPTMAGVAMAVAGLSLGSACDSPERESGTPPKVDVSKSHARALTSFASASAPRDPSVPLDPVEHQKMIDFINRHNDPRIVRSTIDDGGGEVINCVDPIYQNGLDQPPAPVGKAPIYPSMQHPMQAAEPTSFLQRRSVELTALQDVAEPS